MAEVDFSDFDSAEAWFETQSVETRCMMTSRAALRVAANLCQTGDTVNEGVALVSLRDILTSAGLGLDRPVKVQKQKQAARRGTRLNIRMISSNSADSVASAAAHDARLAAHSVDSAARSVDYAADSAGLSASSTGGSAHGKDPHGDSAAETARSAAYSAVAFDADHVDEDLFAKPVWAGAEIPEAIAANHETFLTYLDSHPDWAFWRRWYAAMWEGSFTDWDLAIEVAKIPEDLWEGDDALKKVAARIWEIEDRYRTAVAVQLVRNSDDTAFALDDEAPLPDEVLDYIKERVGGALNTALKSSGGNVFDENCPEALAISQALQSTNPSAVAGLLNDASLMFQKNLGDRYPPDEGTLIALQVAAFTSAEEICEMDEVARERCLRASKLYLRETLPPIDRQELEEFTVEIAQEAEGEAKEIIEADGRAIAAGKRVGRFVRARFANYSSTIVQWIDKAKKGDARVSWLWKKVRELMDMFEDPPADI